MNGITEPLHTMHAFVLDRVTFRAVEIQVTEVQLMLRSLTDQLEEHVGFTLARQRGLNLRIQTSPDPIPILEASTRVPIVTLNGLEILNGSKSMAFKIVMVVRENTRI